MTSAAQETRDLIAQWAFDARPILGRFHLWLENVEVAWVRGEPAKEFTSDISFMEGGMERLFAVTGAVTALGTRLFGRYGAGKGLDKSGLNQAKKEADAISAYAMSESLWYLSRQLPENHAIMVCVGEGLMPKAGETPEMGSNPQLGFGRVYARPAVARWLDRKVVRLLNRKEYGWEEFYRDIKAAGITVWGAAIDTLENTSRFSKGAETGPMTVLHVFDQPLAITRPYEGYMGNLFLPRAVAERAAEESILISFRTPRAQVMKAIRQDLSRHRPGARPCLDPGRQEPRGAHRRPVAGVDRRRGARRRGRLPPADRHPRFQRVGHLRPDLPHRPLRAGRGAPPLPVRRLRRLGRGHPGRQPGPDAGARRLHLPLHLHLRGALSPGAPGDGARPRRQGLSPPGWARRSAARSTRPASPASGR